MELKDWRGRDHSKPNIRWSGRTASGRKPTQGMNIAEQEVGLAQLPRNGRKGWAGQAGCAKLGNSFFGQMMHGRLEKKQVLQRPKAKEGRRKPNRRSKNNLRKRIITKHLGEKCPLFFGRFRCFAALFQPSLPSFQRQSQSCTGS